MRILLLLATLIGLTLQAQTITEHYIELSVTDTVPVRTKRIVYEFSPQVAEASADAVYEENSDWEKLQRKLEKEATEAQATLIKALTKEGFKAEAGQATGDGYTISSFDEWNTSKPVSVELKNEAELKRLVAFLRNGHKGDGQVSAWEYEAAGDSEVELVGRLYGKASAQARTVAELGGRKLGKLLQAQTPGGSDGHWLTELISEVGRMAAMKGAFADMPGLITGRERTMTFRFELLD